jgi:hypothetical protein
MTVLEAALGGVGPCRRKLSWLEAVVVAMWRSFLLLSTLLAVACGPVRWVPPSPAAAEGTCEGATTSCAGDDTACLEQMAADHIACAIDRSWQLAARGHREAELFDQLAEVAHAQRCGAAPHEARKALAERLLELYPAVRSDIDRVAREGRVDLAARRSHHVRYAISSLGLGDVGASQRDRVFDELEADFRRALDFHEQEAERLAESYPALAQWHRCSEYGKGCSAPGSREWDARANPFGIRLELAGLSECRQLVADWPAAIRSTSLALTETHVRLTLTRCGPLPSRTEHIAVACGMQRAEATLSYDRWGVTGTLEIGVNTFPFEHVGEAATADRPLVGCSVPTPPFATGREALVFALRDRGLARMLASADTSADRLLLLAKRAAREGDLDRAGAAYALLLDGIPTDDHTDEAGAWFADQMGTALYRPARLETEIGMTAGRHWSPPSCF